LYRVDFNIGFPNSTILIEDFNEGFRYYINDHYGSCSIAPINATYSTAVAVDDRILHLETIKEHFLHVNESSYVYEGVSRLRDVDTESWISLRNYQVLNNRTILTDGYVQVYYTRSG